MTQSVDLSDSPYRAEGRAAAAPLTVSPVLSGTQEILASPVMRVFVQHPVTLHHVDGVDVTGVETILQIWAVVHHLHILASKIRTPEDLHPVVALVLREETMRGHNDAAVKDKIATV